MASSSPSILRSKTVSYKKRSISLPSRSHPLIPQLNEQFSREKIEESLNGLESLYDWVDNHFLVLSHTQQQGLQKWADEALDSYLGLLDACEATKDVLSHSRQDLQQLLSVLRRRRDSNDLEGYLSARSKAKKVANKSLKDLKGVKLKQTTLGLNHSQENVAIISISNEAEVVTRAVLEALLSYIAGSKGPSNWSTIVAKLKGKAYYSTTINEIKKVKGELPSSIALENLKNQLEKMETSIRGLEEGLDYVFRRLLKIRVSLLNILYN